MHPINLEKTLGNGLGKETAKRVTGAKPSETPEPKKSNGQTPRSKTSQAEACPLSVTRVELNYLTKTAATEHILFADAEEGDIYADADEDKDSLLDFQILQTILKENQHNPLIDFNTLPTPPAPFKPGGFGTKVPDPEEHLLLSDELLPPSKFDPVDNGSSAASLQTRTHHSNGLPPTRMAGIDLRLPGNSRASKGPNAANGIHRSSHGHAPVNYNANHSLNAQTLRPPHQFSAQNSATIPHSGTYNNRVHQPQTMRPTIPPTRPGSQQPLSAPSQIVAITKEEIEEAIPDNASCVFHVMDRRVNMDLHSKGASLYSLVRSWVQDDPYRQMPKPGANLMEHATPTLRPRQSTKTYTEKQTHNSTAKSDLIPECQDVFTILNGTGTQKIVPSTDFLRRDLVTRSRKVKEQKRKASMARAAAAKRSLKRRGILLPP
jgi:hypothetical protein